MYTLKKSLGQHFLIDESICSKIVDVLMQKEFHHLMEVGPGGGALTKYLVNIPNIDFIAVELDAEKVAFLEKNYPLIKGKLINESILDISCPFSGIFTMIGNFPYNISTQIMFRVLEWHQQIETVIGMFQKEVAERIVSGPNNKDYGILSVLLQAFYKAEYLFDVNENCFNPPPKVKSGVIRLLNQGNPHGITDIKKFIRLVKAAFGQRRKQLRNPLKGMFEKEFLQEPIFTKRAENLSVSEFVYLMNKMK